MARILLGVSGGIAAYKALEVVRLATKAGHAVRVVQTPTTSGSSARASFAALSGAPVLAERVRARPRAGRVPRPGAARSTTRSAISSWSQRRRVPDRAGERRTRSPSSPTGWPTTSLTSAALAATCPVVVAPAMNNHMWEHPATQANLATLRDARRDGARARRRRAGLQGRVGGRPPGRAGRAARRRRGRRARRRAPVGRAAGPRHGRRHARADRRVRYVGNRSSGRMGFALAEEAAALGADVTVVAANVALPAQPARPLRRRRDRRRAAGRCEAAFAGLRRPAHGRRRGRLPPGRAAPAKLKKAGREGLRWRSSPRPTCWPRSAARRRPGQTLVGFAAEHGEDAARRRPRQARAQGPGRRGRQRHRAAGHRLRRRPTTR